MDRRLFVSALLSGLAAPAWAGQFDYSLSNQARWRSFGIDNWTQHDPFERSRPGAKRQPYSTWRLSTSSSRTSQVFDLIGFAEAGRLQYNAIHVSARRKPHAAPTLLTIDEILVWIKRTPGQHHAIGRYQFIPSTLAMLVRRSGLPAGTRFSPQVQDRLAYLLLQDAGYDRFLAGQMRMSDFMDKLAWIWAGLPLRSGRSAYRGVAGNRATISRRFYAQQMQRIFS